MPRLLSFLLTAFTDKEGATRATGTAGAVLTACYFLFAQKSELEAQAKLIDAMVKEQQHQLELFKQEQAKHDEAIWRVIQTKKDK
jgi:hypothetical protein